MIDQNNLSIAALLEKKIEKEIVYIAYIYIYISIFRTLELRNSL